MDGKTILNVPFTAEVQRFSLGKNRLQSMAGFRPGKVATWYGAENFELARRNLMECLLDYNLNPLDLYVLTPRMEDLAWAVERGLSAANLGGGLHSFAHPEPGMVQFVQLWGSKDNRNFEQIPARVTLKQRDPDNPLSDQDLIVTPEQPVDDFSYLKVHYHEKRGWYDRVPYSFVILYPSLGEVIELTCDDGRTVAVKPTQFIQPDKTPAVQSGVSEEKLPRSFQFDNLRNNANLGSVVFETGAGGIKQIRLINRAIEVAQQGMRKHYNEIRRVAGKDFRIYLYGFDETLNHLNLNNS